MLDCDIVLNGADGPLARQVLDHASYAHLIPVIDGGTRFLVMNRSNRIVGKCQVSECGPGIPCLECAGVYSLEEATLARESPRMRGRLAYVHPELSDDREATRAPSVVSHNGLVASLMVQRFLRLALGFPPYEGVAQQRFYVERGEMYWTSLRECKQGCAKKNWIGLGDAHSVPTGVDPDWKEMRT